MQTHTVDRLDLEFATEALDPNITLDTCRSSRRDECGAMGFNMVVDLGAIGRRRQHKRQHLHDIAMCGVAFRKLPIENENTGAKAHIALVEIVVYQRCR